MKIEVTNLKISKKSKEAKDVAELLGAEDEPAFSALIEVDGEQAFYVRNNGDGGINSYIPVGRDSAKEAMARAMAFVVKMPDYICNEDNTVTLPMNMDLYLGMIIRIKQEEEKERDMVKRWCKKYLVYRKPDTPKGTYHKGSAYSKTYADMLRVQFPGIEIMNEVLKLLA